MTFHVEWCLLLFLFKNVASASSDCNDNNLYLIRSTASSLVLDGNSGIVSIQYFDGYTSQLWKFKKGNTPGLFHIINSATEKVLDVDKTNQNRVILAPENGSLKQQWFLHYNGRIVNAEMNKTLDIAWAKYVPGNSIYVLEDNGNTAQEFSVKERMTCCSSARSGSNYGSNMNYRN